MSSEWEEYKLSELAHFRRGSFPQPYGLDKWYDDNAGTPFIQVYDVGDNMQLKPTTKRKISKLAEPMSVFIKKGSLILTIQGSIGRIAVTHYDAYMDRTLLVFQKYLVPVDVHFIKYIIFKLFEKAKENANGSTIKTITKEELSDFTILLPELSQQTKIAKILTTIDNVIEKTEEAIGKYEAIKQGMMQDLFTRGIGEDGQLRPTFEEAPELYKESALGWIPKEWEVRELKEFAVIFYGKDYKNNPNGEGVPIIGTGGIMGYTSIELNRGPALLTGRKGSINSPKYVEGGFWNVDTIFCIKTNNDNKVKWLYYQFCNTDLNKLNEATGVPSVNSSALNNLKFATPKKDEQEDMMKRLNSIDNKIETEKKVLSKQTQLKKGLMQDLLTGKVVVNG